VSNFSEKRLRALPHHFVMEDVLRSDPRYDQLLEAMDWLYDFGPAPLDWYVAEKDGKKMPVDRGNFIMMEFTTTWVFAFRHKKDAILFKLMFL